MPARPTLAQLLATDDFVGRHIGPSAAEQAHMLRTIGVETLDGLLAETVPSIFRLAEALPLPASRTVEDVLAELKSIAAATARAPA